MVKRSTKKTALRKVAIVTGGGTGLGRDIANTLSRDGFNVAIVGRRANRLQMKKGEKRLFAYPGDVGNPDDIKAIVKGVRDRFGRIDTVVNSAAIVRIIPVGKITPADIDEFHRINVAGSMNMALACLPALRKTKGSIINFSSSIATKPSRDMVCYATTKGAVEAFTKILALELAPKVRVNCISPGLVKSEAYLQAGVDPAGIRAIEKFAASIYPMGRVGEPRDVSELARYLISDKAEWLTGLIIPVDGGWSVVGATNVPREGH
tara:strand:- start:669 stop:1460 length:792 start_codon:yes stop_codon:yes gene_type:complete